MLPDGCLKCCFTSTETIGLLGMGAQDVHHDFHTAPELCILSTSWSILCIMQLHIEIYIYMYSSFPHGEWIAHVTIFCYLQRALQHAHSSSSINIRYSSQYYLLSGQLHSVFLEKVNVLSNFLPGQHFTKFGPSFKSYQFGVINLTKITKFMRFDFPSSSQKKTNKEF